MLSLLVSRDYFVIKALAMLASNRIVGNKASDYPITNNLFFYNLLGIRQSSKK